MTFVRFGLEPLMKCIRSLFRAPGSWERSPEHYILREVAFHICMPRSGATLARLQQAPEPGLPSVFLLWMVKSWRLLHWLAALPMPCTAAKQGKFPEYSRFSSQLHAVHASLLTPQIPSCCRACMPFRTWNSTQTGFLIMWILCVPEGQLVDQSLPDRCTAPWSSCSLWQPSPRSLRTSFHSS